VIPAQLERGADERDSPGRRPRVLLIDDEEAIRSGVSRALAAEGLTVDLAQDGPEGLRRAGAECYGLVILDLLMSPMDGRAVLRQLLRSQPGQPVLVLSCLADVRCKVECFDLGARDYLTKPFSLDELLARVRVQLRREHPASDLIKAGHLVLDLGRMQADAGVGPVSLTRLEIMLLRELMEHSGESVTKGTLLASVWGIDFDPGSNVVDVCIRRLRSKLGFELIETVRGAGYRLAS
jgi:two-component system, OmpR family, response regulator